MELLGRELQKLGICSEDFLVLLCSLHNLQTCLRAAVIENLGEGGKAVGDWKRNAMQLLFGVYNLQTPTYHEAEELKKKWEAIARQMGVMKPFRRIPKPVLTRWGVCG